MLPVTQRTIQKWKSVMKYQNEKFMGLHEIYVFNQRVYIS